jgi:hypothetical protein
VRQDAHRLVRRLYPTRCKVLVRSKNRLWPCLAPLIGFWLWVSGRVWTYGSNHPGPSKCNLTVYAVGFNPVVWRLGRNSMRPPDSNTTVVPPSSWPSSRYRWPKPFRIPAWDCEATYQQSAPACPWLVCQPPGWSPRVWTSTSCRNSKTARNLRRVSVLGSPASSSRDRGANPPGDHRESGRPPTCSELACCGRRPPRVVIAVPTRGSALSSSHYRGANPSSSHYRGSTSSSSHYRGSTSSSCHYRGTNRGFSRLIGLPNPHSCPIVVQTRGSTSSSSHYRGSNRGRDSRWQMVVCVSVHTVANGCVCYHPYCKDSGFRLGSRTGGK